MLKGPAKSTPVYEKAGSSFTLNVGKGGCSFESSAQDTSVNYALGQTSPFRYPETSPGLSQCFLHSVMTNPLMGSSHNQFSQGMGSG